jgi:hypothetical protein
VSVETEIVFHWVSRRFSKNSNVGVLSSYETYLPVSNLLPSLGVISVYGTERDFVQFFQKTKRIARLQVPTAQETLSSPTNKAAQRAR